MKHLVLTKILGIGLFLAFSLPAFAQFPNLSGKLVQGKQTTALGITSYSDTVPLHTPTAASWRNNTQIHRDTALGVDYVWRYPRWYANSTVRQSSPPPATRAAGSNFVDYTETLWQNSTDSLTYYYEEKQQCWEPIGTVVRDTTPVSLAATGTSAAVCYEYSLWYNSTNDSLYAYTAGAWLAVGSGGVPDPVDSIAVLQDSIVVGYSSGAEVTRDTIGYPTASVTITASNGLTKTGNDIALGGTLTGATTITGASQDFTLTGLKYYQFEADSAIWRINGNKFLHMGSLNGSSYTRDELAVGYRAGANLPTYNSVANTLFGSYAGENLNGTLTNGASNAMFGYTAGQSITTGSYNTIFGVAAMATAGTTASSNNAFGHHALLGGTGSYNCAFGQASLNATTGNYNVGYGHEVLKLNTSGGNNTAIGSQALANTLTSSNNTAVGFQSLFASTAANNTGVGYQSLVGNTSGIGNTGVGYTSGKGNTISNYNTSIGFEAGLFSEPAIGNNTFIGAFTGRGVSTVTSTASNLTAIGYRALNGYTSSLESTAIGSLALQVVSSGSYNTGVGYQAGGALTTGANNTLIGRSAGNGLVGGSNNVIVGFNCVASGASAANELNLAQALYGTAVLGTNALLGINRAAPLATWNPTYSGNLTATVAAVERRSHMTSGTAAVGFGLNSRDGLENASGTEIIAAERRVVWDNATAGLENAYISWLAVRAGTLTEGMRLDGNGDFQITGSLLKVGGTTSSFPALKRSTVNLIARLADDSANTDLEVLDEAYGVGWNGSLEVPTKNAIYDKIETVGGLYLPLTGGTLTGHLLFTDNTYDLGASGLTRPRTGYFGTSVISPIFDATTGYQIGGAAASGKILKANGTNFVASTETYAAPGSSGNVMTSDGTNWTSAAPASAVVNLSLTGTAQVIELTNSAGTDIVHKGVGIGLSKVTGTKDTLYFTRIEHWGEVSISGGSTAVTAATPERPDNDTPGSPTGNTSSDFSQSGSTVTYIGTAGQLEGTAVVSFSSATDADFLISLYQEGVEITSTEVRASAKAGDYITVALPKVSVAVSLNDTFDLRVEPVSGTHSITVHRYVIYLRKIY